MYVTHLAVTFPCGTQQGANSVAKMMRDLVEQTFQENWPMPQIKVKIECNENEEAIAFKAEGE